jgi:hypothetical protein
MVRPLKTQGQPRKSNTFSFKVINHEMLEDIAKERGSNKSEVIDSLLDNVRGLRGE